MSVDLGLLIKLGQRVEDLFEDPFVLLTLHCVLQRADFGGFVRLTL